MKIEEINRKLKYYYDELERDYENTQKRWAALNMDQQIDQRERNAVSQNHKDT